MHAMSFNPRVWNWAPMDIDDAPAVMTRATNNAEPEDKNQEANPCSVHET
jgi:hypothetical protein